MRLGARLTFFSFVLLTCFAIQAHSQKLETRPQSTGLLLEVVFVKGVRPAFQTVSWTNNKKGTWYGRFDSLGKRDDSDRRVHAVRVVPFIEGSAVRVNVSVLRGKFHEIEEVVGSYLMDIGQKQTVDDLRNVSVAPFELRLFRIDPALANAPTFSNRTKSIEVVSFEPLATTLPAYKVTVHNSSTRNVSAMSIDVFSGGKRRLSSLPHGKEGKALIEAGAFGEFETRVPVDADPAGDGFNPAAKREYEIVINAVIFEDGQYEGDQEMSAMFRGFVLGRKLGLRRINPLLAAASEASPVATTFAKLVTDLNALNLNVAENDLSPLLKQFPQVDFKQLKDSVEMAMHGTRKELTDQAQRFVGRSDLGASDFREWLTDTKTRYEAWLSRLQ